MTRGNNSQAGENNLYLNPQEIMDNLEDEIMVIDANYKVKFANLITRHKLGKEGEGLNDKSCYEIWQGRDKPCVAPLWDCPLKDVIKTGNAKTIVHFARNPGRDSYIKISAYPRRDASGNINGIIELRKDATAERALETQILRRHHQLLVLSYISSAVSGHLDLDTILKIALDNVLEIIHGHVGGILLLDKETGMWQYRVWRGLSPKFVEEMRLPPGQGIAGRVAVSGEPLLIEDLATDSRIIHPDLVSAEGLRGCISVPLKSKKTVVGVMNIVSHIPGRFSADDVSLLSSIGDYLGTAIAQADLYARLARAGERYRTLLRHALTAQEDERKRIARELHDETSQAMTSLTLSLQAIMGMAEMKGIKDEEFMQRLKTTHAYAVRAGTEIVKLMKELRPTLLDELGMTAAIHRYAKDILQAKGINITAQFTGTDRRFQPEIEVTLFRVAQGLIGNILEHSGARNVIIKIECDDNKCVLNIKDDGRGFDVSKITQVDPSGRGAGLFTMKERVRLVGGACHINSEPGHGTDIKVEVPLASEMLGEKN